MERCALRLSEMLGLLMVGILGIVMSGVMGLLHLACWGYFVWNVGVTVCLKLVMFGMLENMFV